MNEWIYEWIMMGWTNEKKIYKDQASSYLWQRDRQIINRWMKRHIFDEWMNEWMNEWTNE